MIGIGFFILIFIWGWVALWVGRKLSGFSFFTRLTINSETGQSTGWDFPVKALLVSLVFLLPMADQIIAYPQWQQLCSHTGDFDYGSGMDEKKAFGRKVRTVFEEHETTIFPFIKVSYSSKQIFDANTDELIFEKPHYQYSAQAFFYLPSSSGDKTAPLLSTCADFRFMTRNDSIYKKLNLTDIKFGVN
jgi:hypothetical protein